MVRSAVGLLATSLPFRHRRRQASCAADVIAAGRPPDQYGEDRLTVGALRAQATDVDLGFRSSERLKKTGTDTVSVLDLAAKLVHRSQRLRLSKGRF